MGNTRLSTFDIDVVTNDASMVFVSFDKDSAFVKEIVGEFQIPIGRDNNDDAEVESATVESFMLFLTMVDNGIVAFLEKVTVVELNICNESKDVNDEENWLLSATDVNGTNVDALMLFVTIVDNGIVAFLEKDTVDELDICNESKDVNDEENWLLWAADVNGTNVDTLMLFVTMVDNGIVAFLEKDTVVELDIGNESEDDKDAENWLLWAAGVNGTNVDAFVLFVTMVDTGIVAFLEKDTVDELNIGNESEDDKDAENWLLWAADVNGTNVDTLMLFVTMVDTGIVAFLEKDTVDELNIGNESKDDKDTENWLLWAASVNGTNVDAFVLFVTMVDTGIVAFLEKDTVDELNIGNESEDDKDAENWLLWGAGVNGTNVDALMLFVTMVDNGIVAFFEEDTVVELDIGNESKDDKDAENWLLWAAGVNGTNVDALMLFVTMVDNGIVAFFEEDTVVELDIGNESKDDKDAENWLLWAAGVNGTNVDALMLFVTMVDNVIVAFFEEDTVVELDIGNESKDDKDAENWLLWAAGVNGTNVDALMLFVTMVDNGIVAFFEEDTVVELDVSNEGEDIKDAENWLLWAADVNGTNVDTLMLFVTMVDTGIVAFLEKDTVDELNIGNESKDDKDTENWLLWAASVNGTNVDAFVLFLTMVDTGIVAFLEKDTVVELDIGNESKDDKDAENWLLWAAGVNGTNVDALMLFVTMVDNGIVAFFEEDTVVELDVSNEGEDIKDAENWLLWAADVNGTNVDTLMLFVTMVDTGIVAFLEKDTVDELNIGNESKDDKDTENWLLWAASVNGTNVDAFVLFVTMVDTGIVAFLEKDTVDELNIGNESEDDKDAENWLLWGAGVNGTNVDALMLFVTMVDNGIVAFFEEDTVVELDIGNESKDDKDAENWLLWAAGVNGTNVDALMLFVTMVDNGIVAFFEEDTVVELDIGNESKDDKDAENWLLWAAGVNGTNVDALMLFVTMVDNGIVAFFEEDTVVELDIGNESKDDKDAENWLLWAAGVNGTNVDALMLFVTMVDNGIVAFFEEDTVVELDVSNEGEDIKDAENWLLWAADVNGTNVDTLMLFVTMVDTGIVAFLEKDTVDELNIGNESKDDKDTENWLLWAASVNGTNVDAFVLFVTMVDTGIVAFLEKDTVDELNIGNESEDDKDAENWLLWGAGVNGTNVDALMLCVTMVDNGIVAFFEEDTVVELDIGNESKDDKDAENWLLWAAGVNGTNVDALMLFVTMVDNGIVAFFEEDTVVELDVSNEGEDIKDAENWLLWAADVNGTNVDTLMLFVTVVDTGIVAFLEKDTVDELNIGNESKDDKDTENWLLWAASVNGTNVDAFVLFVTMVDTGIVAFLEKDTVDELNIGNESEDDKDAENWLLWGAGVNGTNVDALMLFVTMVDNGIVAFFEEDTVVELDIGNESKDDKDAENWLLWAAGVNGTNVDALMLFVTMVDNGIVAFFEEDTVVELDIGNESKDDKDAENWLLWAAGVNGTNVDALMLFVTMVDNGIVAFFEEDTVVELDIGNESKDDKDAENWLLWAAGVNGTNVDALMLFVTMVDNGIVAFFEEDTVVELDIGNESKDDKDAKNWLLWAAGVNGTNVDALMLFVTMVDNGIVAFFEEDTVVELDVSNEGEDIKDAENWLLWAAGVNGTNVDTLMLFVTMVDTGIVAFLEKDTVDELNIGNESEDDKDAENWLLWGAGVNGTNVDAIVVFVTKVDNGIVAFLEKDTVVEFDIGNKSEDDNDAENWLLWAAGVNGTNVDALMLFVTMVDNGIVAFFEEDTVVELDIGNESKDDKDAENWLLWAAGVNGTNVDALMLFVTMVDNGIVAFFEEDTVVELDIGNESKDDKDAENWLLWAAGVNGTNVDALMLFVTMVDNGIVAFFEEDTVVELDIGNESKDDKDAENWLLWAAGVNGTNVDALMLFVTMVDNGIVAFFEEDTVVEHDIGNESKDDKDAKNWLLWAAGVNGTNVDALMLFVTMVDNGIVAFFEEDTVVELDVSNEGEDIKDAENWLLWAASVNGTNVDTLMLFVTMVDTGIVAFLEKDTVDELNIGNESEDDKDAENWLLWGAGVNGTNVDALMLFVTMVDNGIVAFFEEDTVVELDIGNESKDDKDAENWLLWAAGVNGTNVDALMLFVTMVDNGIVAFFVEDTVVELDIGNESKDDKDAENWLLWAAGVNGTNVDALMLFVTMVDNGIVAFFEEDTVVELDIGNESKDDKDAKNWLLWAAGVNGTNVDALMLFVTMVDNGIVAFFEEDTVVELDVSNEGEDIKDAENWLLWAAGVNGTNVDTLMLFVTMVDTGIVAFLEKDTVVEFDIGNKSEDDKDAENWLLWAAGVNGTNVNAFMLFVTMVDNGIVAFFEEDTVVELDIGNESKDDKDAENWLLWAAGVNGTNVEALMLFVTMVDNGIVAFFEEDTVVELDVSNEGEDIKVAENWLLWAAGVNGTNVDTLMLFVTMVDTGIVAFLEKDTVVEFDIGNKSEDDKDGENWLLWAAGVNGTNVNAFMLFVTMVDNGIVAFFEEDTVVELDIGNESKDDKDAENWLLWAAGVNGTNVDALMLFVTMVDTGIVAFFEEDTVVELNIGNESKDDKDAENWLLWAAGVNGTNVDALMLFLTMVDNGIVAFFEEDTVVDLDIGNESKDDKDAENWLLWAAGVNGTNVDALMLFVTMVDNGIVAFFEEDTVVELDVSNEGEDDKDAENWLLWGAGVNGTNVDALMLFVTMVDNGIVAFFEEDTVDELNIGNESKDDKDAENWLLWAAGVNGTNVDALMLFVTMVDNGIVAFFEEDTVVELDIGNESKDDKDAENWLLWAAGVNGTNVYAFVLFVTMVDNGIVAFFEEDTVVELDIGNESKDDKDGENWLLWAAGVNGTNVDAIVVFVTKVDNGIVAFLEKNTVVEFDIGNKSEDDNDAENWLLWAAGVNGTNVDALMLFVTKVDNGRVAFLEKDTVVELDIGNESKDNKDAENWLLWAAGVNGTNVDAFVLFVTMVDNGIVAFLEKDTVVEFDIGNESEDDKDAENWLLWAADVSGTNVDALMLFVTIVDNGIVAFLEKDTVVELDIGNESKNDKDAENWLLWAADVNGTNVDTLMLFVTMVDNGIVAFLEEDTFEVCKIIREREVSINVVIVLLSRVI